MDISQYKDLFITEAQEHLDSLNKFLLQLENEPENMEVLTEIFRSAHTLKGMSATMGYDQLTELAHEMENLLEHLRAGDIAVTTSVVDTLFSCFDTLGSIIGAIAEGRSETIDFQGLVQEVRGVIDEAEAATQVRQTVEPEEHAHEFRPEPVEGEEVVRPGEPAGPEEEEPVAEGGEEAEVKGEATREVGPEPGATEEPETRTGVLVIPDKERRRCSEIPGVRLLRLTVELDSECLLKSVRVFMVFKKLAQLGEVLVAMPPVEELEDEKFGTSFQIGFATTESPERVEKALLAIAEIAGVETEVLHEPKVKARPADEQASRPDKARLSIAKKTQSVRVNIARLDTLMNLVGELVINRTRLAEISSGYDIPELREALDQTARLTAELQDEVMQTRMVPVEHVFNRFPRMVRDLARQQGKNIEFVVEGKEIELDRTILDEISDPLMHMIRNAVDHGIDTPRAREEQGKPEVGTIRLSAYRDRNYVAIEVWDDGSGIDAEGIFDRALARGLITFEEREQLTEADVLRIVAMPGFSTSEAVSGVSGRGVGMDAVKSKAESLGGFVVIESTRAVGTTITLRLPLTLAIVQALMVGVSGEVYAIPLGTVRETHVIQPDEIKTVQNFETIFLREETIPLIRLDQMLECGSELNGSEPLPVVITEMGPRLVALGVHSLMGQQEVVISSLDKFLERVEGFAGATILGTGRVALILDIPSLMSAGIKAV
jgi:two-component system, chemotaxis family, sensor kinase CheA